MAEISRALLRLEAKQEEVGWDAPVSVHTVFRRDGGVFTLPLHLPLHLAPGDRPYLVMRMMAESINTDRVKMPLPPPTLIGCAFSCETWGLPWNAPGAEEARASRTIDQHLDRIEIRYLPCVIEDGTVLLVTRHRFCEPEFHVCDDEEAEGNVIDCLRELTTALLSFRETTT